MLPAKSLPSTPPNARPTHTHPPTPTASSPSACPDRVAACVPSGPGWRSYLGPHSRARLLEHRTEHAHPSAHDRVNMQGRPHVQHRCERDTQWSTWPRLRPPGSVLHRRFLFRVSTSIFVEGRWNRHLQASTESRDDAPSPGPFSISDDGASCAVAQADSSCPAPRMTASYHHSRLRVAQDAGKRGTHTAGLRLSTSTTAPRRPTRRLWPLTVRATAAPRAPLARGRPLAPHAPTAPGTRTLVAPVQGATVVS